MFARFCSNLEIFSPLRTPPCPLPPRASPSSWCVPRITDLNGREMWGWWRASSNILALSPSFYLASQSCIIRFLSCRPKMFWPVLSPHSCDTCLSGSGVNFRLIRRISFTAAPPAKRAGEHTVHTSVIKVSGGFMGGRALTWLLPSSL